MAKAIRVSRPALKWIENEAKRIAATFGERTAGEFRETIRRALERVADFPASAPRGKIPNSRVLVINDRTVLTLVERPGEIIVAAARSPRQKDAFAPAEAITPDDDAPDEPPTGSSSAI